MDAARVGWRLQARQGQRVERCGLPSELGVLDGLRAQPQRQGELRRPCTDKRRPCGGLRDLLLAGSDRTQPMAVAVLEGAGHLLVAAVAIHDATAGTPALAEHRLEHAGGSGLAAKAQAEPEGGEEPGRAMLPLRPPAGRVASLTAVWRSSAMR
jgi:hypothetical protein